MITNKKLLGSATNSFVLLIALGMAVFHMYVASIGVMPGYRQAAIHWGFVGCYILLTRPLKFKGGRIVDIILIALNIYTSHYLIQLQARFVRMAGIYTDMDIYMSILAIILALLIAYRVLGKILPVISIVFILYSLYGQHLPGMLRTVPFTVRRMAPFLFTSAEGLYGQTLSVSAQFIFLFILFGAVLQLTGAGEFFVDLSFSIAGKARGGPAQAAIYASMLMGTINGSGAANVVTTGNFTIPLMKKVGYTPSLAGAIEAVASSGGQIMPPVMGAVAFLMAEVAGIPYATIALAALIPAIMYYITLSVSTYFNARKYEIPAADASQVKPFVSVLKGGWLYFLPLVVLIYMLMDGYSPQRSAFFAIWAAVAVGFVKNRRNMTLKNTAKALKDAVEGISAIAAACILAGIIMGVINMTGLGIQISGMIQQISAGNLILALFFSMLASLVLGMGLPTAAAYMILAVLVAPALIGMGAMPLAAHLFILYFGALSTITPPVALSTFAAAGIAGAGIWQTGYQALKLAATAFIVPFVFVFNPELLLVGSVSTIVFATVTALIGCVVISMSLSGWCGSCLSIPTRIALFVFAILLFLPNPIWANALGLLGTIALVILENRLICNKRNK